MSEPLKLRGRCAVITGAASGIGRALAQEAAARGLALALCDVSTGELESLAAEMREKGAHVLAETVDVRSADAVQLFSDKVFDRFPSIALVFANAGLMRLDSAVRPNPEIWSLTLGVNILGVVHTAAAFLGQMIERGEPAQFVITASQAAFAAAPTISAYCSSKHAMWAYAEILQAELASEASPVRASLLAPGRVASGITMESRERARAAGGDEAAKTYESQLMPADMLARFAIEQAVQRRFWILSSNDYKASLPSRIADLLHPQQPHPLPVQS
jgi:NADP-dependent 3-hydroxy acid dehydrogenase YdfG